ncbi:MAG: GTP 3',8-cyclase MoaA [Candidatus Dormibacteria bacterium]
MGTKERMKPLPMLGALSTVPDRFDRPLRDLRVSVTDLCNFRCGYCMPRSVFGRGHHFLAAKQLLEVDEIVRLAGIFVSLGVDKVRLTGGEPLLRRELPSIVEGVAALPLRDLALTTNGALLRRWAPQLRQAGLRRVTVSLDSLDPATFTRMSDSSAQLAQVLDGIAAAREAALDPVKINCVVRRGVNDAGILDLVEWARHEGLTMRFIEYMDVGTSNGWRREEVVTGDELLAQINAVHPVEKMPAAAGAVAQRYRDIDGGGELGLITSVSRPFCGDCSRARLSADGSLFTCLFAATGTDLRGPLRDGADDQALRDLIEATWRSRDDRYSELRAAQPEPAARVEMSYIGG